MTPETLFRNRRRFEPTIPIKTRRDLELYRRKIGPMPRYARVGSIDLAIAAANLHLQMVEEDEDYKHAMKICATLRAVKNLVVSLDA